MKTAIGILKKEAMIVPGIGSGLVNLAKGTYNAIKNPATGMTRMGGVKQTFSNHAKSNPLTNRGLRYGSAALGGAAALGAGQKIFGSNNQSGQLS